MSSQDGNKKGSKVIDLMAALKEALAKNEAVPASAQNDNATTEEAAAPSEVCIHLPPNLAVMLHVFAAAGYGAFAGRSPYHADYMRDAKKLFDGGFADERVFREKMVALVEAVPDAGPGGWDAAHRALGEA